MNEDVLICIFNFLDASKLRKVDPNDFRGKKEGYYIVYLCAKDGIIETDQLKNFLGTKNILEYNNHTLFGPYSDLNDLKQTSYTICEKIKASSVNLISIEEFNNLVTNTFHGSKLFDALLTSGDSMKNLDSSLKKGILEKIFN